jgi:hypothetical protein
MMSFSALPKGVLKKLDYSALDSFGEVMGKKEVSFS